MSNHDEEKKRSWLIDRAPQQAKQPDPYRGDPYQGLGKRTRTEEANFNPNLPMRAEESPFTVMRRERREREAAKEANAEGAAEHVQRAAADTGAPLPGDVRGKFESSLGTDLSGVRVHTVAASATAADAVAAKAYTTGQDIHFGEGQYDPASKDGQRLLAHEVAHTVQQRGAGASPQPQAKLEVSSPADAHEHEADRAADAMLVGAPAQVSAVSAPANQAAPVQLKSTGRHSQHGVIEMPEDYVGKPDIEMPDDYVGKPDIEMPDDYVGKAGGQLQGSTSSKTPNPTYVNARFYAATYFRRHGELAQLLSQACRDGLHAFSIRSSEEYNKSDSLGLLIFQAALAAIPAAGALAQTLHELTSSEKLSGLSRMARALKQVASSSQQAHDALGRAEGATGTLTKGAAAAEKGQAVSTAGAAKAKGDFEMQTVANLSDLMSDSIAARWRNEDIIVEMLKSLEYTDPAINLEDNVQKVLGKLPEADAVKAAAREVAVEFELRLYLQYYVEPGKVTYVIDEQDGAMRADFEGIPRAVVRRFADLGKSSMLMDHKGLKRRHTVRIWSGNRV